MKTKKYQKYIKSLELKDGKIPPKGYVGAIISFPRDKKSMDALFSVNKSLTGRLMPVLGAKLAAYGRNTFFMVVPAETVNKDGKLWKEDLIYKFSTLQKTKMLCAWDPRMKITCPNVNTYYLPTKEEVVDLLAYWHNIVGQRAIYDHFQDVIWLPNDGNTPTIKEARKRFPSLTDASNTVGVVMFKKKYGPSMKGSSRHERSQGDVYEYVMHDMSAKSDHFAREIMNMVPALARGETAFDPGVELKRLPDYITVESVPTRAEKMRRTDMDKHNKGVLLKSLESAILDPGFREQLFSVIWMGVSGRTITSQKDKLEDHVGF